MSDNEIRAENFQRLQDELGDVDMEDLTALFRRFECENSTEEEERC